MPREWNENTKQIVRLADGARTSIEIAEIVGLSPRYVRKVLLRLNLPRCGEGAQPGGRNHQFVSGRRVDPDGYVLVTAPTDHPYARQRTGRKGKLIFEHRLVLEQHLGRYLLPGEVVDHIDGLTLHNHPDNLRLFVSNADHLAATLGGIAPNLSAAGSRNTGKRTDHGQEIERVDMHAIRRKRGDVRLRQILLAALKLGIDSPYLSGTNHHTKKAGIDMSSRSTIERALDDLYARWGEVHTL
jgi:hypothetical protein